MVIEITYLWVIADGKFIPKETIAEYFSSYGGSFVKSIGEALRHADPFNTYKLLDTFKEYVTQYIQTFDNTERGIGREPVDEKIVASAVNIKISGLVTIGKRHSDAMRIANRVYGVKKIPVEDTGFLTNYGRYLDRDEALEFLKKKDEKKRGNVTYLFSEDLR